MLKRTPLFSAHVEMGAKMVEFGGWEMPLNYGSQIEEHHQVRRNAGMFDVSHMQTVDLRVMDSKNPGVRNFLKYLLANNVDKLQTPGKALYSCMLNDAGGVIDDLIVYFIDETWFRLVVNASTAEKDIAWMEQVRNRILPSLTITPLRDVAMIAVQGPAARDCLIKALTEAKAAAESLKPFNGALVDDYFVARTGYTGEDGFEIVAPAGKALALWKALHAAGVAPIGLGARDSLRLEAGMNLYGNDMDETISPMEAGLAWTVDLASPRDFVGKAALLENPHVRNLVGLVLIDKGVLRAHQRVVTSHGEGETTSGTYSPTLANSIAFARVPVAVKTGDTVQVDIRGNLLNARVVKYPFVRNGKSLID